MSGFRGVMKDGWHPKGKDGSSKESWRGDFKGINQVAGWMGKGKDSSKDDQAEHVSRPLSSLKDPASFGPPPKRGDSRTSATSLSRPTPAPRGLAREEITHEPEQLEEQEQGPPPPPVPYRANRTGLNTEHLPPPPIRRTESPANNTPTPASHPRPNLPPRLPTRNTNTTSPSPPPPPYSEADQSIGMNQGSISRLEQAGVSVPALGIGRRDSDQSVTAQRGMNNQVNELQARFAKMPTPGSQTLQSPVERPTSQRGVDNSTSPALRTDTRSAAPLPPTSNFRQRSNEHIETGKQKLTAFNQKHQITKRIGSFFEEQPALRASQGAPQPPPPPPHPNLSRQGSNIDIEVLNKRKPPPPPPPAKKPNLKSTPVNGGGESPSPPPLPLGTKPR